MKNPKADLPIGIFDSGIGGISVLAAIIKILPNEEFIYFADTLHAPYGNKPENVVRELSIRPLNFYPPSELNVWSLPVIQLLALQSTRFARCALFPWLEWNLP